MTYVLWSKIFCKISKHLTQGKLNLKHGNQNSVDEEMDRRTRVSLSNFLFFRSATIWNRFLFSTSVNQKLLCIIADIPSLFLNHSQVILTVSFGDGVHIKCKIKMIWCCFENHSVLSEDTFRPMMTKEHITFRQAIKTK